MIIAGVQPLSLIDYPGHPCSIIFTQGCVFRCSYCHNPDLIPFIGKEKRDPDEILEFLCSRKEIVSAVCITGGEPTIHGGLIDFIKTLKEKGFLVKLDTNGIKPDVIEKIIDQKLVDYIAMDIKETWERYPSVIRINAEHIVEACKKTAALIQSSGIGHEFRTTILPGVHTEDDILAIASYLKPGETYYIQKTSRKKTLDFLREDDTLDVEEIVARLRGDFPQVSFGLR